MVIDGMDPENIPELMDIKVDNMKRVTTGRRTREFL